MRHIVHISVFIALLSATLSAQVGGMPTLTVDTTAGRGRPARDTSGGQNRAPEGKRVSAPDSAGNGASAATRKKATFDSLDQIKSMQLHRYNAFPASFDSVFDPDVVLPYRIQNSNAAGLSEMLRTVPQSVAVPFALSSSQNRYLLYGFPLLTNAVYPDDNAFGDHADAIHGTDNAFATQVYESKLEMPEGIRLFGIPDELVTPHTDVMWENGVFLENLLGVRFVRPVTKTTDVGLFSNFRRLAPFNYSTANDIKSFYQYFFSDTTMVANGGRNPGVTESQMTLSLASHPSATSSEALSYSYVDSKTDQAIQLYDSGSKTETLQWRSLSRFANVIRTEARGLRLSFVSLNADGMADLENHRLYSPYANSAIIREDAGKLAELDLGIEPYIGIGSDTVSVIGRLLHTDQELYNKANPAATRSDVRLGFRHGGGLGPLYASLALTAGEGAVKPEGKSLHQDLVFSARASLTAGMQRLHLFFLQDHLPYVLPFDSLGAPLESYYDLYRAYGADIFAGFGKIGLAAGACAVSGADTSLFGRFWPDNTMPYAQPTYSFMLAPMIGRIAGFALSSRTMLSDKKPYVKSQATLSYQANPIPGREYITSDLMFDYWSGRDSISYAGISTWNREIFNVSLTTAVHIQGFCVFYKIDNLLNRKFAYQPGYYLPGITFRWGFQWLIPG